MDGAARGEGSGVNCPICDGDTIVLSKDGADRRRKCVNACGHRFTTTEVLKDEHQRLQNAVETVKAVAEQLKAA